MISTVVLLAAMGQFAVYAPVYTAPAYVPVAPAYAPMVTYSFPVVPTVPVVTYAAVPHYHLYSATPGYAGVPLYGNRTVIRQGGFFHPNRTVIYDR